MTDAVQQIAYILSAAAFNQGRVLLAPPSRHSPSWRVFGGGLTGEVRQHGDAQVCSYFLRGPDGKMLRQGVTRNLRTALRTTLDLVHQLSSQDHQAAA